ncbi:hypothetical protein OG455_35655 [Kitasatospora sp. NBC_01287]|uniref:hypothetical protein n=1 Tax=Kitasatospora sp. NBC_01287 TaxID=2903573 RepID=UPI00225BE2CA|nr:hypothetical protein [Kitasatospora sp. NBC_01287]MCX4750780.1 hypothetical protein [Kitasatospora sp. NBC_01287]
MTLQTPQPPPSALRAVLAALTSPAALRQSGAAALLSPTGRLVPAHPLAVHQLPPGTTTARALAAAPRSGWRFLVKDTLAKGGSVEPGGAVVAAAEVMKSAEGHSFAHFAAGPYLDSTMQALDQAWQLVQAQRTSHQARLLSMPGHYATALWLHGIDATPDDDLLIPLAPAPLGITAHRAYPAGELLALLTRPSAARDTDTAAPAAPAAPVSTPLAPVPAF